ncbi:hypothetical protein JMJ35_003023 [Cladonia borealis]|uniref:Uncharacterized protein n=1 Tax=Cladonia borealis TaxID=184061 RepID=A0AA39UCE8_9LECA|nr:hypothetical protein JMJ35_003023 [Cladonia borealis]
MELQAGPARSEASQSAGKRNFQLTAREAIRKLRVLYFQKPKHVQSQHEDHQAKFRFGDLPPELQLQILELILLPGDVHLQVFTGRWGYGCRTIEGLYRTVARASNIDDPVPRWVQRLESLHLKCPSKRSRQVCGEPNEQQPGFGLMAMGKFLYQKGYPMFYGQNTFHLSPGPLALSTSYFSRLRPRHRNLIKSLAVTFTISDLTIEGFQEVQSELKEQKRIMNVKLRDMCREEQLAMWTMSSISVLDSIWRQKLKWLLTWPHLDHVILCGQTWDLIVRGQDMAELFINPMNKPWKRLRCALGSFLQRSIETAREELLAGYEQRGVWTLHNPYGERMTLGGTVIERARWRMDVEEVKEWLSEFGPVVRYKPELKWKVQLRSKKSMMTRSAQASG